MAVFAKLAELRGSSRTYLSDFERLYRFHSLPSGSPEDFCGMARRLASSEGFRLDLSSLVRSVRDRNGGEMTSREMLTLAAMASGGAAIAEAAGPEVDEAAGMVGLLLAGVGGWRQTEDGSNRSSSRKGEPEVGSDQEEVPVIPAAPVRNVAGTGAARVRGSVAGFEVSPEMKETLARLELASMQLKVYLDDIDRRIGRIEPHLEEITSMVNSSAEYLHRLRGNGAPGTEMETAGSDRTAMLKQVEEVFLPEIVQDTCMAGDRGPEVAQPAMAEAARPARPRRSLAETIAAGAEAARVERIERPLPAQVAEPMLRVQSAGGEISAAAPQDSVSSAPDRGEKQAAAGTAPAVRTSLLPSEKNGVEPDHVANESAEIEPAARLRQCADGGQDGLSTSPVEGSRAASRMMPSVQLVVPSAAKTDPMPCAKRDAEQGEKDRIAATSEVASKGSSKPVVVPAISEASTDTEEIDALKGMPRNSPPATTGERMSAAARRTVLGPKPVETSAAATSLPAAGAVKSRTEMIPTEVNSGFAKTAPTRKGVIAARSLEPVVAGETRKPWWRGSAVKVEATLALAIAAIGGGYLYLTAGQDTAVRRHAAGNGVRTDLPKSRIPRVSIDDPLGAGETTVTGGRGYDVTAGAKSPTAKAAVGKGRQGAGSERTRILNASPAPARGRVEPARMSETLPPPRVEVLRPAGDVGASALAEPRLGASSTGGEGVSGPPSVDVPAAAKLRPEVSVARLAISSVALASSLVSARPPIYPANARRLGMEGKVVLEAVVGRNGAVQDVRVIEGPVLFQQSAMEAVRTRRYRPYLVNGQPIEVETRITVSYKR